MLPGIETSLLPFSPSPSATLKKGEKGEKKKGKNHYTLRKGKERPIFYILNIIKANSPPSLNSFIFWPDFKRTFY